jgi:tRNA-Thr(GGU) m(6)t(6)A37 methyltransferase TsaA
MGDGSYEVRVIGRVESSLTDRSSAPKQGDEGAPDAWLAFDPSVHDALNGTGAGDEVFVLTWLHLADRAVLQVHPRDDMSRPLQGIFATRSSARPNPIGLHRTRVLAVDGTRVQVRCLEAVDGTPIVDMKPVIGSEATGR